MEASKYNPKTIRQLYNIFRRGIKSKDNYTTADYEYNFVSQDLYVKVRRYRYWTSELSRHLQNSELLESRSCRLRAFYYDINHDGGGGMVRGHDSLKGCGYISKDDNISYQEFCKYLETGAISLVMQVQFGGYYYVMPEHVVQFRGSAFETIPQWWLCDGNGSRHEGHRHKVEIVRGYRYCKEYLDANYRRCAESNELLHVSEFIEYNGRNDICKRVLLKNHNVRQCDSCGKIHDDYLYIKVCNECGSSQQKHLDSKTYLSEYHNYMPLKKLVAEEEEHEAIKYFLGCEIEVDGYGYPDEENGNEEELLHIRSFEAVGDVQHDSSLSEGFEVVLNPCSHGYLKVRLKALVNHLSHEWSSGGDERVGMHIHVGRDNLSNEHIRRIDYFVNQHKNHICTLAGRESEEWSRFTKAEDMRSRDWEEFGVTGDNGRYEAINLENSKTIEFRIFRSPSDFEEFCTMVDLVQAIVEFNEHTNQLFLTSNHITVWHAFRFFVREHKYKYDRLVKKQRLILT